MEERGVVGGRSGAGLRPGSRCGVCTRGRAAQVPSCVRPARRGGSGSHCPGPGGVVADGDAELPERIDVGLDQVRPGGVRRGEAALDGVGGAPFAQGQVVEDHGKRLATGSKLPDRLQPMERRRGALAGFDMPDEPVATDRTPRERLPGAVGLVASRPEQCGVPLRARGEAPSSLTASRPNSSRRSCGPNPV